MSVCPYESEIEDSVMSNFDREIDQAVAERLRTEERFSRYAGWNFNGRVWWDRELSVWKCEVWTYGSPKDVVLSDTLEDVMTTVSNRWGYD